MNWSEPTSDCIGADTRVDQAQHYFSFSRFTFFREPRHLSLFICLVTISAVLLYSPLSASSLSEVWKQSEFIPEDYFPESRVGIARNYVANSSSFAFMMPTCMAGRIGGTAFNDFNNDGSQAPTETRRSGINVRVFNNVGQEIPGSPVVTDANGEWVIDGVTDGEDYRIEYTIPSNLGLLQSAIGTFNKSDIQFVNAPDCASGFGVVSAEDFCQSNPRVITTCFVNGDRTQGGANDVIVSVAYGASGTNPGITEEATKSQVGSVWGIAYNRDNGVLYSSAFLKRHVDLGPGGLGAIYATNIATSANGAVFATIPNAGTIPNAVTRGLGAVAGLSRDQEAFGKIGKVGLGDIDISPDNKNLFVVNLNDKKLYTVDIATATPNAGVDIPDPSCVMGDFRPFAVKYKGGKVYVGGVCATSLSAVVYEYDPIANAFNTTPILSFSLTYTRGGAVWNNTGATGAAGQNAAVHTTRWYAWEDVYTKPAFNTINFPGDARDLPSHSQPVFTDIEFDDAGNIIMGFFDRTGHQFGESNYVPTSNTLAASIAGGDILRATNTPTGFVIEPHVGSGGTEFFGGEELGNGSDHAETSSGGIAYLPGSNQVFISALDPINYTSGGLIRLSTQTGAQPTSPNPNGIQLFAGGNPNGFFGKSTGIGDVEFLCNALPIQIGNYAWIDADADGIQDPSELPLGDIPVTLVDKSNDAVVAVTTTDATTGEYYFAEADGLLKDKDYAIVFGYDGNNPSNNVYTNGTFNLNGKTYVITTENVNSVSVTDASDSDAEIMTQGSIVDFPMIMHSTGDSTTYSLDIGVIEKPTITITDQDITCGPISDGGSIAVSVEGGIKPYSYNWSTAFANDTMINNVPTGTYYLTVTDATNCEVVDSVMITVEACSPVVCTNGTTIGGKVFNDPDANGVDDGDGGFQTVRVQLFECGADGISTLIETTYTSSDGSYVFDGTGLDNSTRYRVEFSNIPEGYTSSVFGSDNGTETQFVTGFSCDVDYGIVNPASCPDNPLVLTTCFINGTAAAQGANAAIVAFNFDGTGSIATVASGSQTGATWGVAYDANSQKAYVSEVLKRHSGTGSNGLGGIYSIDFSMGVAGGATLFTTVPNVGSVTRALSASPSDPSADGPAFDAIGKQGIGDIDLSLDGSTMYVMNLAMSRVDILDVMTQTVTGSISFPSIGCTIRPWALKVDGADIYAGAVCEDELQAYVFKANGNLFEIVDLDSGSGNDYFDLSYARESAWSLNPTFFGSNQCNISQLSPDALTWHTWITSWPTPLCSDPFGSGEDYVIYPQPILSDIEFDEDGAIILGFMDRMGMQGGFLNQDPDGNGNYVTIGSGDIIKICNSENGFLPEGSTGCPFTDVGDDLGYVPGGGALNASLDDGAEFFNGDDWLNGSGDGEHYETFLGGLALKKGANQIVGTVFDPINGSFNAGGIKVFDPNTGASSSGIEIYGNGDVGTFAKAVGLGDVELLCNSLKTVEIGNYAWIDTNADGIQDPCEDPIADVKVKLYSKPTSGVPVLLDSTLTSATGEYYFTDSLTVDSSYYIVFCGDTYNAELNSIAVDGADYALTVKDMGTGINPDFNDSDAEEMDIPGVGMLPAICVTVDSIDHTLDVGLVPKPIIEIAVTNVTCGPVEEGGTVMVSITGGMAPFTYDWSDDSFDGDSTAVNAPIGFYSVTVTDAAGCAVVDTASVSATPCLPVTCNAVNQIGGTVFNDPDADGTDDGDGGFQGVRVQIFECQPDGMSQLIESTYTSSDGSYVFTDPSIDNTTRYRVEFSRIPDGYTSSVEGSDNGTETQFVTGFSCDVDYGIVNPNDFCQENPMMMTPCYVSSPDNNEDVLIRFSYNNVGTAAGDKFVVAESQMTGSLWGVAYAKRSKVLYTSAVLKGHIPLGPEGLDAIYSVNPFSNTPNADPWIELTDDLGIAVSDVVADPQYHSNTARGLNEIVQNDEQAFQDVGKVGIGDIELSADEQTLYVVNLYDKTLYAISVATKQIVASYPITQPSCSMGDARPWALAERNGEIYVGVICDGAASGIPADLSDSSGASNLSATVYHLDGGTFVEVLHFSLDYPREEPFRYTDFCSDIDRWKPWISTIPQTCGDGNIGYPTPLLTDIEFADNGNMILGFTDRTGFQFGFENYGPVGTTLYSMYSAGDILMACASGEVWNIESVVDGCSTDGQAIGTTDMEGYIPSFGGFLEKEGEFFDGDYFHNSGGIDGTGLSFFPGHPEITIGGLAVVPGTGEVMSTSYDPVTGADNFNTGGVIVLDIETGKRSRNGYEIYRTFDPNTTLGKGIGLGDIEALCDLAPIQLGNYVWIDANGDGIQDPCEAPVSGLTVKLYTKPSNGDTARLAATTITDADGEYYFTNNTTTGETWETGYTEIQKDSSYFIVFCGDSYNAETNAITQGSSVFALTTANAGMSMNPDFNDSDAAELDVTDVGMLPAICVTADSINHTLDVGLQPKPDVAVRQVLDPDYDLTGLSIGDSVKFKIIVYNQGLGSIDSLEIIDYVPEGFTFNPMIAGNAEWGTTVAGAPIAVIRDQLVGGGKDSICIYLTLGAYDDPTDLINVVEISNAYTGGTPIEDCDSPLNQDPDDNVGSQIGTPADDYILGDGTATGPDGVAATDQDNVDPATIPICDLALINVIDSIPTNFTVGDTVKYAVIVENQGTVPATNVAINYSIPNGLEYLSVNATGVFTWSPGAGGASATITDVLGVGESDTLCIYLKIKNLSANDVTEDSWTTLAEISRFEDPSAPGTPKSDVDSTPDTDPTNDSGGNPDDDTDNETGGDGTGDPMDPIEDMDPTKDEDDHDPAKIEICDAAAIIYTDDVGPFEYGDTVKFSVVVYNQGNDTITNVNLDNDVGAGLEYIADASNIAEGWTGSGDSLRAITTANIAPGASDTICLNLVLRSTSTLMADDYLQFIEIVSYEDSDTPGALKRDIDSTPDSDPTNDPGGNPNDTTDNTPDGDGSGDPNVPADDMDPTKDEDDSDPVLLHIFDLALDKKLVGTKTSFADGDTVTFNITIYNQGNVTAQTFTIVDYLNRGFIVSGQNNLGWTSTADSAVYVSTTPLAPGQIEMKTIELVVVTPSNPITSMDYWNYAEIVSADDNAIPGDTPPVDADSDPDDDVNNDNMLVPESPDDNEITENGKKGDDEDDHDIASIEVGFDLALNKVITSSGPYTYGDTVVFAINVTNQGGQTVSDVAVYDAIPCGFDFIPALNAGWDLIGDIAVDTIPGPIATGEVVSLNIALVIQACTELAESNHYNVAEIADFRDEDGNPPTTPDIDSTPNGDPDDDGDNPVDDEVDNVGSGDEDDHDFAVIELCDLALTNTLAEEVSDPKVGDTVKFVVRVYNQGNTSATNVAIGYEIPAGLEYLSQNTSQTPAWTSSSPELATIVLATTDTLSPGDVDSVCIYLRLKQPAQSDIDEDSWTTIAEIQSFADKAGDPKTEDLDSTPDNDFTNDPGGNPDDDTDNEIDGDGTGDPNVPQEDEDPTKDEDDHDPAKVYVCDEAITIKTEDGGPHKYGDTVKYIVTIYNQGNDSTTNTAVLNTVGGGLDYIATQGNTDAGWVENSAGNLTITVGDTIAPGDSVTVCLEMVIEMDESPDEMSWQQIVEITKFEDPEDPGIPKNDFDSTPDADPNNDSGGNPEDGTDDVIDGDGTGDPMVPAEDMDPTKDEDDHDPVKLEICDMALTNVIVSDIEDPKVGDTIKFVIKLYNQGNTASRNVQLGYEIPEGFEFLPSNTALTPAWVSNSPSLATVVLATTDTLQVGAVDSVCIYLKLVQPTLAEVDEDSWTTLAEIQSFADITGTTKTEDIDSSPDLDFTNDPGGNPEDDTDNETGGDGTGDPNNPMEDMDPDKDEDDHDPAKVYICDEAVTISTEDDGPHRYGDTVKYTVTIYNQGNGLTTNTDVLNTVGDGLLYIPTAGNMSAGWNEATNGDLMVTSTEVLAPGDSVNICLELVIEMDDNPSDMSWQQVVEITKFEDPENPGEPKNDFDSTPDTDPNNDSGGNPDDDTDDEIDGDGTGDSNDPVDDMDPAKDEDDHDPVRLEICDLALTNELAQVINLPKVGDTIKYNVKVFNQGNQDATDIQVGYKIPAGLKYLPMNASLTPAWTEVNGELATAMVASTDTLAPGTNTTICINLEVTDVPVDIADVSIWTTLAEIQSFADVSGVTKTEDIDSNPDTDFENDPGGNPNDETDNVTNGDGTGDPNDPTEDMDPTKDEDDHDPADIYVCDAAIKIFTTDEGPHFYGDTVKYTVVIYNQGNGDINNVSIQDIVQSGQRYIPTPSNDTSGWSVVSDEILTNTVEDIIGPGDSIVICLELLVEVTEMPNPLDYTQLVEITRFEDPANPGIGKGDVDSTPDDNPNNDPGGNLDDDTDDEVNGMGTGDPNNPTEDMDPMMDEDDHDGVSIKLYDIAVIHTKVYPDSVYDFGDIIEMEVVICNQSNDDVTNIKVVNYVPLTLDPNVPENTTIGWNLSALPVASYVYTDVLPSGKSDTIKLYGRFKMESSSDIEDFVSRVEICRFEDDRGNGTDGTGPNNGIKDADSTPDQIETNDAGGAPFTSSDDAKNGNGLNGGGMFLDEDPTTDEDDHDPVILGSVDIAITIVPMDTMTPVLVGDTVTYIVDICNQGTFDLSEIVIAGYIPAGCSSIDPKWSATTIDSIITYTMSDILPFMTSMEVILQVVIDSIATVDNLTICAEVASFADDEGNDFSDLDIDSTPDMIPNNDAGGAVYTLSDDAKNGDGSGLPGDPNPDTDEDDHDSAVPPILDLALIKTIIDPRPVIPGDLVTFTITVINQGNITAKDVKIIDLIPAGLELADGDWSSISSTEASYTIPGEIKRGEEVEVDVTFKVKVGAKVTELLNVAEIEQVFNVAGLNIDGRDIDSKPADDNGEDAAVVFTSEDDNAATNGFLGESADDSDPSALPVFDLALRKVITGDAVANNGGTLTFDITIFNQGNVSAVGVNIIDYIPAGMKFLDVPANIAWVEASANATYFIADTIKPNTSKTISISLQVLDNSDPLQLVNVAEISSVDQGVDQMGIVSMNPGDIDSTPDGINNDVGGEPYSDLDDIINQDGRNGEDEDDNDQAYPIVCSSMACNNSVNLILDEDCNTLITADLLLRGNLYPGKFYDIVITDSRGIDHPNAFDVSDAGQTFTVSVNNTLCGNACWGYVNIENKNIPKTITSTIETMCGAPDADFISLKDIAQGLESACVLPVTDLVEEFTQSGDKCDGETTIRVVRGSVTLEGKSQKVILRRDTTIVTPLDTTMITCPGSMDLLDAKRIDCSELKGAYPTPAVVAALRGERMAYPYVDKGDVIDSTWVTVKVDRDSLRKDKVLLDNGLWALFDIVDKYEIDSSYYEYDITPTWIPIKEGIQTCNMAAKYEDEVFEGCAGEASKIKRKWTVLDWCKGQTKVCYQWIFITDEIAPKLELTTTEVLADVAPWICAAEVELSDYVKTTAGCSDVVVTYETTAGVLKGSHLSSLWLVESPVTVTVTASNKCGADTSATFIIRVADMTAPVAIALDKVNASVTGDPEGDGGLAKVYVESIDAGSHDSGCGDVQMCVLLDEELQDPLIYIGYWSTLSGLNTEAGLYEATGQQLSIDGALIYNQHGCTADGYVYTYALNKGVAVQTGKIPYVLCKDYVKFCCGDLGEHKVALIVDDYSPYSRSGISWSIVKVEDKSAGRWSCVSETVPCAYVNGFIPQNKPRFGGEFCNEFDIREITRDDNINTCGEGSITILWGAYDQDDNEISTTECIYPLGGRKEFNPYEIKWPKHYTDETYEGVSRECEPINAAQDTFMIVEYQEDAISMGGSFECSVMADTGGPVWCTEACGLIASSYEDEEIEAADACKKIVRRWTVIDWCTWEANGSSIDDDNDSGADQFEAVDDEWLRVNEGIDDALTDSREVSTVFINGSRVTDLDCKECEKPSGRVDDIYFRYKSVDEDGYYTYDQIIKIIDETAPVITASSDTVSIVVGAQAKNDDFENCVGSGIVTATASDVCGANTLVDATTLVWSIEVRDEDDKLIVGPQQVKGASAEMTTGVGMPGDVHEIIWQVTDGCGNIAIERTAVTFTDDKNPTPVCIQDISTAAMSTDGSAEIWASDYDIGSFDNCSPVKFAFLVDDNGDITEDEVIGNLVPSVRFDCDDISGSSGNILELRMYVIDDYGNFDFCNVTLRIDDNNDICPDANSGAALIAGSLSTETGEMIESVQVSLEGAQKQMMTPVDGSYLFTNTTMGSDYQIQVLRDGDYLNGVSTIDLVKIQRHILGVENLDSPYKIIAADVSNDERVSALDLIHLRKILLGIDTKFSNNTSWRFVDAGQELSSTNPWPFTEAIDINNLSSNRRDQNFIGVKIGDVSGNAIANSAIAAEGRSANVVALTATDQTINTGEVVSIDITSTNFADIVGLQYTMDINGLEYAGIESGAIEITEDHIAVLDDNTITTAWHQSAPGAITDATLFTLHFVATQEVRLSEAITLSSRVTAKGAYDVSATESDVSLTFEDEYSVIEGMQLMQNQPNPFHKTTDISFILPKGGEATLTVFDVTGKVVFNQVAEYSRGLHTITFDKEEIGVASGVMYYQLESNDEVATRKMIIVE